MARRAVVERETKETKIRAEIDLDGGGQIQISTGIGFLDHLLELFAFHAGIGLNLAAKGDLHVDDHHTVEDVGIVLGKALREALGDRRGIERYGFCVLPMDEVLARAAVDVSGRSVLRYQARFERLAIGGFATENVPEFFRALVRESRITLHLEILNPGNEHHQAEALFKAFGRALRAAVRISGEGVASTKGTLE